MALPGIGVRPTGVLYEELRAVTRECFREELRREFGVWPALPGPVAEAVRIYLESPDFLAVTRAVARGG